MSDILVSKYRDRPVVAGYINNRLQYLSVIHNSRLSNIYLCRVENVVRNIDAVFVRFEGDELGYLQIKDILPGAIVNRDAVEKFSVRQGDEIIVQLETESIKLKKPKFTTYISFSGKYSVVTMGRRGIGASTKLSSDDRKRLIGLVKPEVNELVQEYRNKLFSMDFGIIIRTESAGLSEDTARQIITDDIRSCLNELSDILKEGHSRTVFSCLHRGNGGQVDAQIQAASRFLSLKDSSEIRVIESSVIYSPANDIDKLLRNRVWLESGAFLIIEQLESFNAIDVNTGKAIKGKNDIIKKINYEAAEEIFRQIRLRNLSGMILIDFINMKSNEDNEDLCSYVRRLAEKESVHTEFIDMTGLGIIELVRKKNDKSLKEILENGQNIIDNTYLQ